MIAIIIYYISGTNIKLSNVTKEQCEAIRTKINEDAPGFGISADENEHVWINLRNVEMVVIEERLATIQEENLAKNVKWKDAVNQTRNAFENVGQTLNAQVNK